MVRRISNDGYTLAGMCLVIFALSVLTVLSAAGFREPDLSWLSWSAGYLEAQADAIRMADRRTAPSVREWPEVTFNEKGNVSRAATVYAGNREAVISLGGGRRVFR